MKLLITKVKDIEGGSQLPLPEGWEMGARTEQAAAC